MLFLRLQRSMSTDTGRVKIRMDQYNGRDQQAALGVRNSPVPAQKGKQGDDDQPVDVIEHVEQEQQRENDARRR